ncbi:TIGR04076 family protein [Vibrio algarum]|uniref:TIGR04076 family protein n=1 Tax=Vibrio algarum TaxID=3020714 RepID=A0ABT4YN14_9VIBR|nr:TIGR04076 family protein [Vibrio sp. KJ40-1]MDB1122941.1 TIGR04076 family protein [Vibrio sp. KJ40-1]
MDRRKFLKNGLVGVGVAIASSHVIAKEGNQIQADKPHIAFPSVGNKVIARIISSEAPCSIGMKSGDEFELGLRKCGNFCGFFYSSIHKSITDLQFGEIGQGPDTQVFECPNSMNKVKLELRRIAV